MLALMMVNIIVEGPGAIHTSTKCTSDYVNIGGTITDCGTLTGKTYTAPFGASTFKITFKSSSVDGGAAMGFKLKIEGFDGMLG